MNTEKINKFLKIFRKYKVDMNEPNVYCVRKKVNIDNEEKWFVSLKIYTDISKYGSIECNNLNGTEPSIWLRIYALWLTRKIKK